MQTLSILLAYFLPITFTIGFCFYTKWQIVDEDDGPNYNKSDKKWHEAGLLMRASVTLLVLSWFIVPPPPVKHILLITTLCAFLFDTGINLARGMNMFYVAKHGWDGKVGKLKWVLYGACCALSVAMLFIWS